MHSPSHGLSRNEPITSTRAGHFASPKRRAGHVLVLIALLLPAMILVIGLVIDAGLLTTKRRDLQQVTDAGATAAAMELFLSDDRTAAQQAAVDYIHQWNAMEDATVTMDNPPKTGMYAGDANFVEVTSSRMCRTYLVHGGGPTRRVFARSVAGSRAATAGAAVMVLDPDPPPFSLAPILTLPALPAILGGLEILGAGRVNVHGAVIVNTEWGGLDELGRLAGSHVAPPYGISCTPILPLTKLRADDIRVVGGVDKPTNYGSYQSGASKPLKANRMAVPDPFKTLPAPTLAADPNNVKSTYYGGQTYIGVPILGFLSTKHFYPGVYDYIDIVSGNVIFHPGVYILRDKSPVTQASLSIVAGQVQANGVMFYITNSGSYSPASGSPDAADGETSPANNSVTGLLPSVIINIGLLSSQFSPLNDPSSPFHDMFIYQRRQDRRPIVLIQENLLGSGQMQGTVYSKWGHLILAGKGTYNARLVSGSMRVVALLDVTIAPNTLLPPAYDVFLVE